MASFFCFSARCCAGFLYGVTTLWAFIVIPFFLSDAVILPGVALGSCMANHFMTVYCYSIACRYITGGNTGFNGIILYNWYQEKHFCEVILQEIGNLIIVEMLLWKLRNYCLVINRFFPTFVLSAGETGIQEKGTLLVPFSKRLLVWILKGSGGPTSTDLCSPMYITSTCLTGCCTSMRYRRDSLL